MYVLLFLLALVSPQGTDSQFEMLTQERISMLPEDERRAWTDYLVRSQQLADKERAALAEECSSVGKSKSDPAPGNSREFEPDKDTPADWYSSDEAKRLTETVRSYQTPSGGWSKAIDYSRGPRPKGTHWTSQNGAGWHYCGTLDNRSTTEQIRFLARVYSHTKNEQAKLAVMNGLEWLFTAQYPNGGWPQNYPVESGYHEAITLNDDAMLHAMELLLDVAEGAEPFQFAEDSLRDRARDSIQEGLICLARMQIRISNQPTVWCAQHDPISLAPVSARKKEPVSLSGGESASMLKFLMRRGPTDAKTQAIIEPAIRWLDEHRITGLRKVKNPEGKTDYVPDAASSEIYWARFYDFHSGKPIFAGAEDGIIYSTYSEMAQHNRVGYDYFTTKPRDLLEKEVPRWKKRLASKKQ
jgi:PelA/Pel-15E family pectate lyase